MSATTERRRAKPLTERAKEYPSDMLEWLSLHEHMLALRTRSSEATRANRRRLRLIYSADDKGRG